MEFSGRVMMNTLHMETNKSIEVCAVLNIVTVGLVVQNTSIEVCVRAFLRYTNYRESESHIDRGVFGRWRIAGRRVIIALLYGSTLRLRATIIKHIDKGVVEIKQARSDFVSNLGRDHRFNFVRSDHIDS